MTTNKGDRIELENVNHPGKVTLVDDAMQISLNADHQSGDSYFALIDKILPHDVQSGNTTPIEVRRILPQHRETYGFTTPGPC